MELVRSLFDAWNSGELSSVMPLVSDGIELLEVEGVPEAAGAERQGKEAVLAGLESLFETWQHYRLEPQDVRGVEPDLVVAVVREVARGRASGVEVESDWGYVMTIRDRKLVRVEAYRNPAHALEAVGLSE